MKVRVPNLPPNDVEEDDVFRDVFMSKKASGEGQSDMEQTESSVRILSSFSNRRFHVLLYCYYFHFRVSATLATSPTTCTAYKTTCHRKYIDRIFVIYVSNIALSVGF